MGPGFPREGVSCGRLRGNEAAGETVFRDARGLPEIMAAQKKPPDLLTLRQEAAMILVGML